MARASFKCKKCHRDFKSSAAISRHYEKAPAHASKFSKHSTSPYPSSVKARRKTKREQAPKRKVKRRVKKSAPVPLEVKKKRAVWRAEYHRNRGAGTLRKRQALANGVTTYNFCPNCAFPVGGTEAEVNRWQG